MILGTEELALEVFRTSLQDVLVLKPTILGDERGYFFEAYNEATFGSLGISAKFVQDNHSGSSKGVLRGLHYQLNHPQGKLIRVLSGEVFDVAVDLRQDSPQFRKWFGVKLTAENRRMLWIPPGFGHGFLVTSEFAEVSYKATDFYDPASELCILWNDPTIGIDWPIREEPVISQRDREGVLLKEAETYSRVSSED